MATAKLLLKPHPSYLVTPHSMLGAECYHKPPAASHQCAASAPFQRLLLSDSRFPPCCRPHRNLEAVLQAAQESVATLQLEKDVALSEVKYFLDRCQELKEVNGALVTIE